MKKQIIIKGLVAMFAASTLCLGCTGAKKEEAPTATPAAPMAAPMPTPAPAAPTPDAGAPAPTGQPTGGQ
ncbi:MAG: hypothetical protein HY877_07960 [Deltaproteobacteria bacterium]|nr:hypothetical protein [Deltaproteobacteria bacterium]